MKSERVKQVARVSEIEHPLPTYVCLLSPVLRRVLSFARLQVRNMSLVFAPWIRYLFRAKLPGACSAGQLLVCQTRMQGRIAIPNVLRDLFCHRHNR